MADQTKEKVVRTAQGAGLDPRSDVAAMLDVVNTLTRRLRRFLPNKAGLTIGTSDPAEVKSGNTMDFIIDGAWVRKTAAEYPVPAEAAMSDATGAKEVWVGYSSEDGATVNGVAGDVAASGLAEKPAMPDDEALIGFVKIGAASNVAFVPGTTPLDATGITDTYEDRAFIDEELTKLDVIQ
jgi:hypothetical protein